MPAIKDRCIVVPLDEKDILSTVESLPRLPSESGIIDVQWKRRVVQKNAHLQAKVEPRRIFMALNYLRECGHKHYKQTQSSEEYKQRCLREDPEGYTLIFGPDSNSNRGKLKIEFIPDGTP